MATLSRGAVLLVCLGCLTPGAPARAAADTVRVAAPGLRAAGLAQSDADRVVAAFARELEAEALEVTTAQEIADRVGRERQQQLLGCEADASSCLAEISSALDADAVLTGSVAKIGTRYLANLKVLSPGGSVMGVLSRSDNTLDGLIDALAEGAHLTAADIYRSTGRPVPESARSRVAARPRPNHLSVWVPLIFVGAYSLELERALLPQLSATAAAVYVHTGDGVDRGWEVLLSGRWFPFGQAPLGLWGAGEVQGGYGVRAATATQAGAAGALFAAGVAVGYTFSPGYGLMFSGGLSVHRQLGPFEFSNSVGSPVQLLLRANVGYAF